MLLTDDDVPLCKFYKLISAAPDVQRADRSAGGTLPTQAYRYCEPIAAASGYGWYLYPPLNFKLMLDNDEILWTYEGADGWFALGRAVQFPHFPDEYRAKAPEGMGEPPTLIAQGLMPGTVQIWSGYLARTRPDWSLMVRGCVNVAEKQAYRNFEGIIESDRWFGPLFTNIRLTRSNSPIEFHKRYPLFQVMPVPRAAYTNHDFRIETEFQPEDWEDFEKTIRPNTDQYRKLGRYAVETRKSHSK